MYNLCVVIFLVGEILCRAEYIFSSQPFLVQAAVCKLHGGLRWPQYNYIGSEVDLYRQQPRLSTVLIQMELYLE